MVCRKYGLPANDVNSLLHRVYASRSGVAAIEFAIVAPVLLLILIGIIVYGLYFGTVHAVQQLAADSARASVAGLTDSERVQLASRHALLGAGNFFLLDRSRLKVEANADADDVSGSTFVVTLTYDASNLPIYTFGKLVALPPPMISRSASIRRGGF